jgi:hypothetical protein
MPYKVKGKNVYHFKHGRWLLKEKTRSHRNAIRAEHLLYGIEHGWKPSKKR